MKKIIINGKNNCKNKLKPKEDLIHLINDLNSSIKKYYRATIEIINNYKKENTFNLFINMDIINIENQLSHFINEAKDLFRRMIIARKRSKLDEEKDKKIQGQLYNYCNNNFFYYSNGPTNLNTNSNYFTKILNHGRHQKINYKSPPNKINNSSTSKISFQNNTQNSYKKLNKDTSKLFSSDSIVSKELNKKIVIPKLNLEKKEDKDELITNILNLLKQLNQFHYNIFYKTKEAKNYQNILNKM